jgi:uncharacterized surface protein with fasciclin (FAS1) repeats
MMNNIRFNARKPWMPLLLGLVTLSLLTTSALASRKGSWWQDRWSPPNLVERLEKDGRFSTLLFALETAGLKETLATGGPFTLLAPTDDAFAAVPPETLEAVLADPEGLLTQILLYHVIDGRENSSRLLRQITPTTLQGDAVIVVREQNKVIVNGLRVIDANNQASNGVFHALDGVLLPPEEPTPVSSLVDILTLDGRFNTLLFALDEAGLTETLATAGPFTLLAPTDEAFAQVPEETLEAILADPEGLLTQILLYHVIDGTQKARSLYHAGEAETLQGETVSVSYSHWQLTINSANVLSYDVFAPNGVIHMIDEVLVPPAAPSGTLVDLLAADGRFTTLLGALEATGLDEALAGEGPFTVLAPTDDAFADLDPDALSALVSDPEALTAVLLYHVVEGDRSLDDLNDDRKVTTLQGTSVTFWSWWRGKVNFVNRSRITESDLRAENGRAHVINRVLIPR